MAYATTMQHVDHLIFSYLPTPISTYLNGLEDRIPQESHGRHHCLGDPMIGDAQETTK